MFFVLNQAIDQGMLQRNNQAAQKRNFKQNGHLATGFLLEYQEIKDLSLECNQAIEVNFCQLKFLKFLIPVVNGSTDLMSMTTLCTIVVAADHIQNSINSGICNIRMHIRKYTHYKDLSRIRRMYTRSIASYILRSNYYMPG